MSKPCHVQVMSCPSDIMSERYHVQVMSCPSDIMSKRYNVQVMSCPSDVMSKRCHVQVISCPSDVMSKRKHIYPCNIKSYLGNFPVQFMENKYGMLIFQITVKSYRTVARKPEIVQTHWSSFQQNLWYFPDSLYKVMGKLECQKSFRFARWYLGLRGLYLTGLSFSMCRWMINDPAVITVNKI